MPTTRRRCVRGWKVLRLGDLSIEEMLDFQCGWHPPEFEVDPRVCRWRTWEEFDHDYELVRDEFLASEWLRNYLARGGVVFAEERYQAAREGLIEGD